jgi:hypothetical protein
MSRPFMEKQPLIQGNHQPAFNFPGKNHMVMFEHGEHA